jgi:hypothetical protein
MMAIQCILGAYHLDQSIHAEDVALMLDRFAARLNKLFQPKTMLVETSKDDVIIDHKSFLEKRADWPGKALAYSGQLAAYRGARHSSAIESPWIHFAAGGGLVQVE